MARKKNQWERLEWLACSRDTAYFIHHYCQVYDATTRGWIPFALWPSQVEALDALAGRRLLCILKARQLGLSWLVLGYALWWMLFRPAATVLLFSKRDDEAVNLLSFRLRGMYQRLPAWLQCREEAKAAAHEWRLSNGSTALAFPTTGGRSYTATLAVVDEADFAPDLDGLLNAVKPTIDGGGRLVLLSTVDKERQASAFKRLYWAGKGGEGGWASLFLPWSARPDRSQAWYALQKADVLARTGFLDALHQEYPATDLQALAPKTADVRFAAEWLQSCSAGPTAVPGSDDGSRRQASVPPLPGLEVYELPVADRRYVIGADPAEGNPQSDDSAATVLAWETGAEVASLGGQFDPAVFGSHLDALSAVYNGAPVMVERNNHGHAVILWLSENGAAELLPGIDGKPGWLTTMKSKALAYDNAAERFSRGEATIRSAQTLRQLQAVRGSDLAAPEGQRDDRAMSLVLALAAIKWCQPGTGRSVVIRAVDPIEEADSQPWRSVERGGF